MKNALWLSRFQPTAVQRADLYRLGFQVTCLEEGVRLASINILVEDDVFDIVAQLKCLSEKHNACAIFGVFATPILEAMFRACNEGHKQKDIVELCFAGLPLQCYSAWQTLRWDSDEPLFVHHKWLQVGIL